MLEQLQILIMPQVKVQTINTGSIDEFIIDDAGTGYAVGDNLIINNENTNGTGAAQVSVVGGGIAPESGSTAPSFDTLLMMFHKDLTILIVSLIRLVSMI